METKHKEFNAYDKVLVKDQNNIWQIDFYSHKNKKGNNFTLAFGGSLLIQDDNILPYEGNEHLVGSDQNPDEEVKLDLGDVCVFFDDLRQLNRISDLIIDQFLCAHETEDVLCQNGEAKIWNYAIRFSDFNPNDMEETSRHILCVRNGKVVRYKG